MVFLFFLNGNGGNNLFVEIFWVKNVQTEKKWGHYTNDHLMAVTEDLKNWPGPKFGLFKNFWPQINFFLTSSKSFY